MSIRATMIIALGLVLGGGAPACSLIDGHPLTDDAHYIDARDGFDDVDVRPVDGDAADWDSGAGLPPTVQDALDGAGTGDLDAAPDRADISSSYHGFVPRPSGYWSFDMLGADDTPEDDLDRYHPVSLYRASLAGGKVGSGLALDGETSYAQIDHDPAFEPGPNATVALWVMADRLPSMRVPPNTVELFSKGAFEHDWDVLVSADNFISVSVGTAWSATGSALVLGRWTHIAAVYQDDARVLLYVNGRLVDSRPVGVPRQPAAAPIRLGNGTWLTDRGFQGRIDEFAIWPSALTEDQIIVLYARGLEGRRLTD